MLEMTAIVESVIEYLFFGYTSVIRIMYDMATEYIIVLNGFNRDIKDTGNDFINEQIEY